MRSALLAYLPRFAAVEISPDQVQLLIYAIIAAVVVGGLGSARALVEIIRFFKGDPPADQRFASKAEVANALAEIQSVERRLFASLTEWKTQSERDRAELRESMREIFDEIRSFHRTVGRLEGKPPKE
jgi:hypothetical protein